MKKKKWLKKWPARIFVSLESSDIKNVPKISASFTVLSFNLGSKHVERNIPILLLTKS